MSVLIRRLGPFFFPSILWRTHHSSVHLTFDDGPHPCATYKVLDILGRRKIRATFFLVGNDALLHPQVVRRIAEEGHSIGNHAFSHRSLFFKPKSLQVSEIEKTDEILAQIVGKRPIYFRPPYGYFDRNTLRAAKETHHKLVMWDVDPRDYDARPVQEIVEDVASNTRHGSIILFHDNHSTEDTVGQFLNPVLNRLEERGYQFSALTV
ncbi:MAG: polysaccharide deacetylase family protein [Ignavibacteria bacterium]|nr:polysaccharide deacetylase family protein [Ignavibacteria bacterium]